MPFPTTPPTGTKDRYPEEFRIRQYIFDIRRTVCQGFGYEEYLTPLVENADIYRAKSGEDVGGSELTLLTERDGSVGNLALRPEMTPSVTRMVASNYTQMSKPVRYFSVANYYRNEKPQRGRNREFWQLNVDMFGNKSAMGDGEILQIAMEIMKAFDPPKDSRQLRLNHRQLIDVVLDHIGVNDKNKRDIVRTMDKWHKLSPQECEKTLTKLGCEEKQIAGLTTYMQASTIESLVTAFPDIAQTPGYQELEHIVEYLTKLGYTNFVFSPDIIRGFDYYDGMVFEVTDLHPHNARALFGGGRYNGLGGLFGVDDMPAVGFAPGDESMKLFLESRDMLEGIRTQQKSVKYFVPWVQKNLLTETMRLAQYLRTQGYHVIQGLERQKFGKALQTADKNNYEYTVILGENEYNEGKYTIKNMTTGEEIQQNLGKQ